MRYVLLSWMDKDKLETPDKFQLNLTHLVSPSERNLKGTQIT